MPQAELRARHVSDTAKIEQGRTNCHNQEEVKAVVVA